MGALPQGEGRPLSMYSCIHIYVPLCSYVCPLFPLSASAACTSMYGYVWMYIYIIGTYDLLADSNKHFYLVVWEVVGAYAPLLA